MASRKYHQNYNHLHKLLLLKYLGLKLKLTKVVGLCVCNRTINSAAKCWASAADPPFPQNNILPPLSNFFNYLYGLNYIIRHI